jgi:hypothetical protein
MNRIERCNFIHGVGLAAGAATAATLIESPALARTEAPTGARPVNYEPKPFSLIPRRSRAFPRKSW